MKPHIAATPGSLKVVHSFDRLPARGRSACLGFGVTAHDDDADLEGAICSKQGCMSCQAALTRACMRYSPLKSGGPARLLQCGEEAQTGLHQRA